MTVFIRIFMRVFAGFLVGWGIPADAINPLTDDPDVIRGVEIMLGAAVWAAAEIYYLLAKRFGWAT